MSLFQTVREVCAVAFTMSRIADGYLPRSEARAILLTAVDSGVEADGRREEPEQVAA